jgi:purine nucleosidase
MKRMQLLSPRIQLGLLLFALLTGNLLFVFASAAAQAPDDGPDGITRQLYLPYVGAESTLSQPAATGDAEVDAARHQGGAASPLRLIVDTDPGVDDATALLWLLRQRTRPVTLLGIVTVAGNTDLYNATNNAITLLKKAGRTDIPVIMGAAAPSVQPLSQTGYFIHGPDGLWFQGQQNWQGLDGVRTDATRFYCDTVGQNPGATLLVLGPMTNIANTLDVDAGCPDIMRTLGELVVLGGAKLGGNKTPIAEYNFWQDPEAAEHVLHAGLPVTLVPYDAFVQSTVDLKSIQELARNGDAAVQFLLPALLQYATVQIQNTGRAVIPDAVAAVQAVSPAEGRTSPGLVKLVLPASLARGQSVIGFTSAERIAMLATDAELSGLAIRAFAYPPDPTFNLQFELWQILNREPDNAAIVTSINKNLLTKKVLAVLRK